ncbi:MAG: methyltransferase domain-containing protein [Acidobacteriota bacterium]
MTQKEDLPGLGKKQTEREEWSPKLATPAQKPSIIDTWLSQFEERIARDFHRRTGLDYKATIREIVEAAEPFPGMRILDIPTGTGVIARQFVGKIGDEGKIIGVDTTREKVEEARLAAQSAKASMRIEWRVMPGERLSLESDSFDLVTSAMAFHRLNGEKFLAEAHRVLKSGGRLLIADELAPAMAPSPLRESVRRNYYKHIARNPAEAEAKFSSTEEMMRMMAETGFSQIMFKALRQRSKHDRVFTLINAVK